MITLNRRYLAAANDIAQKLEMGGFSVCLTDEYNPYYEDDVLRSIRQNLSPHDWDTDAERDALEHLTWELEYA